jgi:nitroreductase/NAD-dependent dihydropyrimidine dehydrogenase PreA subunit
MSTLLVEQEKCLVCGACADVCPADFIAMGAEGPEERENSRCIECGHCVAVCPTAAMDHVLTPLAEQEPIRKDLVWDAAAAKQFLRSRRSIRTYKDRKVPREELVQLLDVARFAPTGSNRQGISFQVISDEERLHAIWKAIIAWMEEQVASAQGRGFTYLKIHIQASYRGKDTILRGAPHLILALAPDTLGQSAGRSNAEFVLAYAELYAPAIGLGTCWAGFVQHCAFSGYEPLLKLLDIPEGKQLAGALMAGYPEHRYQRMVNRNPLEVEWK